MKISDDTLIICAAIGVAAFLFWDSRRMDNSPNGDQVMTTQSVLSNLPTDASDGAGSVLQDVANTVGVVSTSSVPVIP